MPKKGTKKVTMEITWQVEMWVNDDTIYNDAIDLIELQTLSDEDIEIIDYIQVDWRKV